MDHVILLSLIRLRKNFKHMVVYVLYYGPTPYNVVRRRLSHLTVSWYTVFPIFSGTYRGLKLDSVESQCQLNRSLLLHLTI